MKGASSHAHVEAVIGAVLITLAVALPVAWLEPFGLTAAAPLLGLPWWFWLAGACYAVLYPLRLRAWRPGP